MDKTSRGYRLAPDVVEGLDRLAARRGISKTAVIEALVRRELAEERQEERIALLEARLAELEARLSTHPTSPDRPQ